MFQMEFAFVDGEPDVKAVSEATRLYMLEFDAIAAMIADRDQPTGNTSRKRRSWARPTTSNAELPAHQQLHLFADRPCIHSLLGEFRCGFR